jgi:hypothetical protein
LYQMAFGYQLVVVNLCRTATFPPQAWKTALNLARECGVNLSELCSVFSDDQRVWSGAVSERPPPRARPASATLGRARCCVQGSAPRPLEEAL